MSDFNLPLTLIIVMNLLVFANTVVLILAFIMMFIFLNNSFRQVGNILTSVWWSKKVTNEQ
jgi:hypothetical protein